MKKLLLTTAAVAAFSTSAFAFGDSGFYLRVDGSAHRFNRVGLEGEDSNGNPAQSSCASDISGAAEAGAGYNIDEKARLELVYGYHFSPTWNQNVDPIKTKTTAKIQTAMLKAYYDVFDFGQAKIFVGAGVGGSRISTKTNAVAGNNKEVISSKSKNNFSWLLALGSSYDITDAIKVDVQYNFQDFGKTSKLKDSDGDESGTQSLRSNSIKAGIRFNI